MEFTIHTLLHKHEFISSIHDLKIIYYYKNIIQHLEQCKNYVGRKYVLCKIVGRRQDRKKLSQESAEEPQNFAD